MRGSYSLRSTAKMRPCHQRLFTHFPRETVRKVSETRTAPVLLAQDREMLPPPP